MASFSRNPEIPTTRRASKVCTSLITARSDEELAHQTELFKEVSVKVADRPGGYTRIIKTGRRLGDDAEMCFIELVDYNENMAKAPVKKATRTRRSKKSSSTVAANEVSTENTSVEATASATEETAKAE